MMKAGNILMAAAGALMFFGIARVSANESAEVSAESVRTETFADKLEYNQRTGWVECVGHVVIRRGDQVLKADRVRVHPKSGEVFAYGNVFLKRREGPWRGSKLHYNFKTREGIATDLRGISGPVRVIKTEKAEKAEGDTYILHGAMVTTCTNEYPHCHYHVRARRVAVKADEYMTGRDAVLYFGRVPFFYLPYWYRDLEENYGWSVRPGYNSRMGAFLLTGYKYPVSPGLKAETHVDYRSRRGLGLGQELGWPMDAGGGDVAVYYIDDDEPVDGDEDPATSDIDNERYRFRLRHQYAFDANSYFQAKINYLSDPDILEDFFEREHRRASRPENYLTYGYRKDAFTASVLLQRRLNDFYTSVNRLPECSVEVLRAELGDSGLYYEGGMAAAFLEKEWRETDDGNEDYSAFRLDTPHMLYYPRKYIGFLNVTPRIGYRATYYSKTRDTREETVASGTNGTVSAANTVTVEYETGPRLRSNAELGMSASFKAFKTWFRDNAPMRHVVEPHADYKIITEPTVEPDRLYQFDNVDKVEEEHSVSAGIRNKWQTKRGNRPFDLVDIDFTVKTDLDGMDGSGGTESIEFDAELQPSDWFWFESKGIFYVDGEDQDKWNSRLNLSLRERLQAGLEYRVKEQESRLLISSVTYAPTAGWQYNLFGRYEFEDYRFEEHGGYIQRTLDCMVIKTGWSFLPGYDIDENREQEDEWRVGLEIWLTAFPDIGLSARHED
ncbi:MAG: LPS assembly protein LptD [Kiritimatiellia bacterium]